MQWIFAIFIAASDSPRSVLAVNLCRWPGPQVSGLGQAEASHGQQRHRPREPCAEPHVSVCMCCLCCGQRVIVTRVPGSRHLNIDRGRQLRARRSLAPAQTVLRHRHELLSSGVSSLLSRLMPPKPASCIYISTTMAVQFKQLKSSWSERQSMSCLSPIATQTGKKKRSKIM